MAKKDWYDKQKFPLYEIEWDDAASDGQWGSVEHHRGEGIAKCRTVGYLTLNEKTHVQVVQSLSHFGGVDSSMSIPRGCVTKMRKIRQ